MNTIQVECFQSDLNKTHDLSPFPIYVHLS